MQRKSTVPCTAPLKPGPLFTQFGCTANCPYFRDVEKTIYSDEYTKLLYLLWEKRNEINITMGERCGVIHSWAGKVELRERRLDLIEYIRYCKALEVDPHEGLDLILRAPG